MPGPVWISFCPLKPQSFSKAKLFCKVGKQARFYRSICGSQQVVKGNGSFVVLGVFPGHSAPGSK